MALPTNSGSNVLAAIPSLVQLFVGSGKQTGTKTTTSAKSASSTSTNALTSILNQPGPDTNAAVQNAIDIMFRNNMPSIGSIEKGSGIFNSSATKEAVTQLGATAAAKAAEIDLAQQNKNTEQKMAAAGTLGQLTATDTTTQKGTEQTGAAIDPMIAALGLGGLMLGNKLMKGFGSDNAPVGGAANIDFTPVVKQPDLGSIFDINFESGAGKMAEGLKAATFDPVTGGQVTGGGSDFLNVLSDVASNSLFSAVGDFFGGLFGGSSGGDSGSSMGTVICTRMHELGYMDDDTYMADSIYGAIVKEFNPSLFAWYHSWAIPFVTNWLHGRTLGSKLVIQLMRPIVAIWSAYMKHELAKAGI